MRQRPRTVLQATTLVLSVAVWGACGGASPTDFGSDAGTGSGSGSGSGSSSGGSSGGSSGSSSGGSSGSSGGSSSGGSSGSSSGGSSGGSSGSSSGGSSGGSSGSSGGSSGSSSGSSSGGMGNAIDCPNAPCSGGTVCCADPGGATVTCSPACSSSDTLECLQPSDCNGNRDCCETVVVNGGQAPNCTVVSLSSRCESNCKSNLLAACQGTDTLHLCGQASDCSDDAASPNCCMVGAQYACVGNALAMAGLSCM